MSARGPAARTVELDDDYPAINELYVERGWTDGLPTIPPTEGRGAEFLRPTTPDPPRGGAVPAPGRRCAARGGRRRAGGGGRPAAGTGGGHDREARHQCRHGGLPAGILPGA